ncbi:HmgD [Drosophila busckii]|uniref:HmgD n=1 Tax=Drosophila busckii TaxID=30019 RepID=A0A0M4EJZ1_DROBS|nr:high mobility group protein D [Drosophila busckii]XP_017837575.1 high mobility group protein D [Drosophila busckii]ALC41642.1 HmgD [Drosophila busckii]
MADKPKRPLSAYMIWLNSAREQIKRENPGIKVTEVAKRGGELWRGMKDKSEWEAKAAKAKDDYDRAVKDYEANGGGGGGATANGAKKRAKPAKKAAKKSKKDESDDDDEDESE